MTEAAPRPIDVQAFQFKIHCKLQVGNVNEISKTSCTNLVCCANRYGLTFVGSSGCELHVIQLSRIVESCVDAKKITTEYPSRVIKLPGHPVQIALSCDQTLLAAVSTTGDNAILSVFETSSFLSRNVKTIVSGMEISKTKLTSMCWNPGVSSTFTCCFSNGSVQMYEISVNGISPSYSLPAASQTTSMCWSPKGKQIVIGSMTGTVTQYKPELKAVKSIPPPPGQNYSVVNILWAANTQFVVAYKSTSDPTASPVLVVVNTPKNEPVKYIAYEDVCYNMGEMRPLQYYFLFQPVWSIIVVASSNSIDVGVLGSSADNPSAWQQWIQSDESRAELPLSPVTKQETFPIGIALDTSSQHQLPWHDNQRLFPMPTMSILSNEGVLTVYNVINLNPPAQTICTAPEVVPDQSGAGEFVVRSANVIPTNQGVTEPTKTDPSPVAGNIFTTPPNKISFGNTTNETPPSKISFGNTPSENVTPVRTGNSRDLFGNSTGTGNKSTFGLSESPSSVGIGKLPETQSPQVIQTSKPAEKTVEITQDASKDEDLRLKRVQMELRQNQMLAEKQHLLKQINDDKHAVATRIARMKKQASTVNITIGSDEEKSYLVRTCDQLERFYTELKEITKTQKCEELRAIKQLLLEGFALLEDATSRMNHMNNPQFVRLVKLQHLHPVSDKKQADIQSLIYYLESQLDQVNKKLDDEWNAFQDSCRKNLHRGLEPPTLEIVYQSMKRQNEIVQKQHYIIKDIKSRLSAALKRKTTSTLLKSDADITHLMNHMRAMKVDGFDEIIKNKVTRVIETEQKLTKDRVDKLRNLLASEMVVKIVPIKPTNMSASILKSPPLYSAFRRAVNLSGNEKVTLNSYYEDVSSGEDVVHDALQNSVQSAVQGQNVMQPISMLQNMIDNHDKPSAIRDEFMNVLNETPAIVDNKSPGICQTANPPAFTLSANNHQKSAFVFTNTQKPNEPKVTSPTVSNKSATPTLFGLLTNKPEADKAAFKFGETPKSAPFSFGTTTTTTTPFAGVSYQKDAKPFEEKKGAVQIATDVKDVAPKVFSFGSGVTITPVEPPKAAFSFSLDKKSDVGGEKKETLPVGGAFSFGGGDGPKTPIFGGLTSGSSIFTNVPTSGGSIFGTIKPEKPALFGAPTIFGAKDTPSDSGDTATSPKENPPLFKSSSGNNASVTLDLSHTQAENTSKPTASIPTPKTNDATPAVPAFSFASSSVFPTTTTPSLSIFGAPVTTASTDRVTSTVTPERATETASPDRGTETVSTDQVGEIVAKDTPVTDPVSVVATITTATTVTTASTDNAATVTTASTTQTSAISPFAQPTGGSIFGKSAGTSIFGASTTTAAPSIFSVAAAAAATTTPSPFQTTPIFGTSTFGATPATTTTAAETFGNLSAGVNAFSFSTAASQIAASTVASPFGSSPVGASPFGQIATTVSSPFGQSTTSVASPFGQVTATVATSPFGQTQATVASPFGQTQTTAASPFGQTSTTVASPFGQTQTTVASPFGQTSTTVASPFGQTQTTVASPFGQQTATTATPSPFGSSTFGQTGGSIFGQAPSPSGGNIFGKPTDASPFAQTTQSSIFGQSDQSSFMNQSICSPFGQKSPASTFGTGENIFKAATLDTATNAFGGATNAAFDVQTAKTIFGRSTFGASTTTASTNLFGSSTTTNAFGSAASGATTFGASSFGQAPAFGSSFGATTFGQSTGGFGTPEKTGGNVFGGAATFGGSPGGFGAAPAFGSPPAFGGGASPIFGGGTSPGAPVFGVQENPTFSSFANQNIGFGALAQNATTTPPAMPFGGGSQFSQWRS